MNETLQSILDNIVHWGLELLWAIIFLFIALKIVKMVTKSLKNGRWLARLDPGVKSFIISFITIALKLLVFVSTLGILGLPMTSVITLVGSIGVAIGLALQGGLSNLTGGVMILIFKPFKVGDYISSLTYSGTVEAITLFYTTLITSNNEKVMLPNGNLSNSEIVNYSALPKRRLDLQINVSSATKASKVKEIIEDILSRQEEILKDDEIFVHIIDYATDSIVFGIRVWALQDDLGNLKYKILEEIKEEFDKNKIKMLYNKIDVNVLK